MRMHPVSSPAAGKKRSTVSQSQWNWLLALLCLAAALLVTVHLKPEGAGYVYSLSAPAAIARTAPLREREQTATGTVSVNTAGVDELVTVPGIGPATAQAIVDERLQHGLFYYPEDLLCVYGIGEKTLVKILPYVNLD